MAVQDALHLTLENCLQSHKQWDLAIVTLPFLTLFSFYSFLFFGHTKWLLGEGNGNPLQCSCLKNSMERRTW